MNIPNNVTTVFPAYVPSPSPKFLEACDKLPRIAQKIIIFALKVFFMIATPFLWIFRSTLKKRYQYFSFDLEKKKFERSLKTKLAIHAITPPPASLSIEVKTKTQSYNLVREFCIHEGLIWHRKRGSKEEFAPLYFPGALTKTAAKWISVDGCNLIVIDHSDQVHYRKIAKEVRPPHVETAKSLQEREKIWAKKKRHPYLQNLLNIDNQRLIFIDKIEKNNWKSSWFSFPILKYLVNLVAGRTLQIPNDTIALSISQRGKFSNYLENGLGKKDYNENGVTTLYLLRENATTHKQMISKYDPWSPHWSSVNISLPIKESCCFYAMNMSVSASRIVVWGQEKNLITGEIKAALYHCLIDIDAAGWNPILDYTWDPQNADPRKITLPIEPTWQEIPLPEKGEFSEDVSIEQIDEGNRAHCISLGAVFEGSFGTYRLDLRDQTQTWHFTPNPYYNPRPLRKDFPNIDPQQHTFTHNDLKVSLFDVHAIKLELSFTHKETAFSGLLLRKLNLKNYLGITSHKFIPYFEDQKAEEAFCERYHIKPHTPIFITIHQKSITLKIGKHHITLH